MLGTPFDKILGSWFFYVSLMQGVDAVLWKNQTCDSFHKNVSYAGSILNTSQPVVLSIIVSLFNKHVRHPGIVVAAAAVALGYNIYLLVKQNKDTYYCTQPRPNDPHLLWNWTSTPEYLTTWSVYLSTLYIISFFGMPTVIDGVLFSNGILVGLLLTWLMYPRQSIGSIWCFFTALVPAVFLIYRNVV
jgi:hypothetical protein